MFAVGRESGYASGCARAPVWALALGKQSEFEFEVAGFDSDNRLDVGLKDQAGS